ncbi:MAG: phosphatase [Runella sp.]
MASSPKAIIDLGTNTFHLLIISQQDQQLNTLYKESIAVKIGKSGINQQTIAPDAQERALNALTQFRQKINEYRVPLANVKAIGTSALRNAQNTRDFCKAVADQTGIFIEVISGEREAELIYEGVKQALDLGTAPSLIMDIGGGSVEFVIANAARIFWKQSFEIGGQRLLEKFSPSDPISPSTIARIHSYLQQQLLPLHNAMHQYAPCTLVGSSGTFDTLADLDFIHRKGELPPASATSFEISLAEFQRQYQLLINSTRAERVAMPGMKNLRVDLIVVSVIMIDYILKSFDIQQILCSTYSLKEGILAAWVLQK